MYVTMMYSSLLKESESEYDMIFMKAPNLHKLLSHLDGITIAPAPVETPDKCQ